MTAEYNLPLHVTSQNGDDYVIEDGYPHDGGVTPPGMGWDGQGDGGGKFRLKRRRRCGQCAPCQVKENCNKCQYCMRKDVLKQACIYRKCVYLRKPVPRFRQDLPVGAIQKSAPTPPRKPATTQVATAVTNSSNNNNSNSSASQNVSSNTTTSAPASALSSPSSIPSVASSHQSELSSCRLNQSPFAALSAMNNSMLDPLRHRMMEHQHRSSLFDTMGHHHSVLDPSKASIGDMSRYPAGASGFSSTHCKLDQGAAGMNHSNDMNLAAAAAAAASPLNSMSSHHGHHQANKAVPSRDPYFPSMDTWSSMPYALPRPHSWAPPALPNHHAAAAAYGFQQHSTPFPSSFTPSSCRLGLPDSAAVSRYASPQHSFHHSMAGFSQDLTHATANHANHSSMRSPMNTPFYPTAPHIAPSSIPGFTSLGQFPPNQASFGPAAYPMHPHAHMYPGGFYSTFRTATEPQIYHVEIFPSQNPFKHFLSLLPTFSTNLASEKGDNFNEKILDMNICKEIFDPLYGNKLISGTSPVQNIVNKSKEYSSEDIDEVKENIPFNHPQVWNESCMKDWKDVKQVIPLHRGDKPFRSETENLLMGCKPQTKGRRKSFRKSNKDQEIFDWLDKLSYFPECGEIEDFTSLSSRLSDGVEFDSEYDTIRTCNRSHAINSRESISTCRAELTPPSSPSISQLSGLRYPPLSHCVPKGAFSSVKMWPSPSSDHSADHQVTGGLDRSFQRVNKPCHRLNKHCHWLNKPCHRLNKPCHRVRRQIRVILQSIKIKKKYLSLKKRMSTSKNGSSVSALERCDLKL